MTQIRVFRPRFVQSMLRRMERWALRNADKIVCSAGLVSHVKAVSSDADVEEWYYPGCSDRASDESVAELRRELGLSNDAQVVLYSGSFELYQGLSTLVAAAQHVLAEAPSTVFVLVGWDGISPLPEGSGLLQEKRSLKIVRRRPHSEIPTYLKIADVVVSPRSQFENLPLKVFDYMMAGKAIVATDTPCHRLVLNEERAVMVEASDSGIAQGVLQLLVDPDRAKALGEAASIFAVDQLSGLSFARFVEELYRTLASRFSRRGSPAVPETA